MSDAPPPTESAFPDEDEDTITMLDVIEREDELEEEASAVLGNSDEKNCTFPKGYIPRQALYSCATCSDGDKHAAICLACSLECHDNHEVYELYTKRNYRCDCGNSRFKPGFKCKLLLDKQSKEPPLNERNKYNHNFSGRYCICDKKYPPDEADDSAESNDEMWQCIVCEDWYHTKHLGAEELPKKFEELICSSCVTKLDFIHYYRDLEKLVHNENKTAAEKVEEVEAAAQNEELKASPSVKEMPSSSLDTNKSSWSASEPTKSDTICESDTNDSQAENKDPVKGSNTSISQVAEQECLLKKLKNTQHSQLSISSDSSSTSTVQKTAYHPVFWTDCQWRAKLCRCPDCMDMYKAKECEYLLDEKDTVQYYEAQGKAIAKNSESPFERGMTALNRMNRAAVVEALHGYDELKADLSDYLRKFADTNKVVREEDIHEFFKQLKSKKRQRLDFSDS